MPLSDLKLKKIYRTKQDNITDVLIIPALKESNVYDRGTGYFTLDSLIELILLSSPYAFKRAIHSPTFRMSVIEYLR